MSRVDAIRSEIERVGVDEFVRRRVMFQDMPLRLMQALQRVDLADAMEVYGVKRPAKHTWTARRIQVMRLIADGHSNQEIAAELAVAYQTVCSHVKTILKLLEARNRAHAVHKAHLENIINGDEGGA